MKLTVSVLSGILAAYGVLAVPTTMARAAGLDCPLYKCSTEKIPVCGNDGKTYDNECFLLTAQCENKDLKKASDGACPAGLDCPLYKCTTEKVPVCGNDGQTYDNECFLLTAQCENKGLKKASDGACPKRPCPILACTLELNPVCGSDGKTYDNPCLLDAAACDNKSLKLDHKGACAKPAGCEKDAKCTREYRPICGSDGVTYNNECLLKYARRCSNPDLKIKSEGECEPEPEKCPTVACTFEYEPLCGTDGQTYGNKCALDAAKCEKKDLKEDYAGECKNSTSKPAAGKPECPMMCTADYSPVCGSDGKTYGNECAFNAEACKDDSLTLKSKGECPSEATSSGPFVPPCPITVCTADFNPVCGSDGKTYSNMCLLNAAACNDESIVFASQGECETKTPAAPAADCSAPKAAKYWTGKPYSVSGDRKAVQVAARWSAVEGATAYLVCFVLDSNESNCYKYTPTSNNRTIHWDTGASLYNEKEAPTISEVTVSVIGCEKTSTPVKIVNGVFDTTCNVKNAKGEGAVKSAKLTKTDGTDDKTVGLKMDVTTTDAAKDVETWEKCTDRVEKSGRVRRYCSYYPNNSNGESFTLTNDALSTENTSAFYTDIRAVGSCIPPVVSNTVQL